MERRFPSLALVFASSPNTKESISFNGISLTDAKKLFDKAYFRFVLTKARNNRKEAGRISELAPSSISGAISRHGLEAEFPPIWKSRSDYEFTFEPLSTEAYIPFNGTLPDLEERFMLQTLIQKNRNKKAAFAALRSADGDIYLGKVLARLQKRQDLEFLSLSLRQEPILFNGTLAELQTRYMMQTIERCGMNKAKAQFALGFRTSNAFETALTKRNLGRSRVHGKRKVIKTKLPQP